MPGPIKLIAPLLLALAVPVVTMAAPPKPTSKAPAASADLLPFKAVEKTLPNGLKVIVVPTGFPNIVSLQIPVQTGSRNEIEPGKSGFAHFFEHMMFRGTKKYPPEKYQGILTRAGARQNAYTTDDYTNYHTTFAKDDLETILEIEADRFQNLWYPEEDFRTESRAVLGEYNKNSADPLTKLLEVQRDHAFTTHTYKHTTMGFLKDIEDMPNQYAYSRAFFDRWYRPEYSTIIVAGDVEPARVLALVEKYWGGWKRGTYKAAIPQEPAPKAAVAAHVPWATPTLPWVTVAFRGPAFSDREKDYAATDLLLDLLFGPTSDLYKTLVEREQVVDQFFPYFPSNADPALATIGARLKKPEDALRVRDEILRTLAQARATAVPAARLEDAKSNARYGLVRTLDNTEAIAGLLARYVRYERSYATLNNYYRVVASLTPDDLQRAAVKYLGDANLVVTTLAHGALAPDMAKVPALSSLAAAPAAAAGPAIEPIVQRTALPLVNLQIRFLAGSVQDPPGKEGLASLAAAMIADGGSKDLRVDEITRAFFPLAAGFNARVDKEMTTFSGVVHRDNWQRFADIAFPMLLDPGFRPDDFERLKQRQLNALVTDLRSNNEEELGKERLQARVFAGTRWAHPVLGTVSGINAITLDDVKAFVRQAYHRGNLVLGLAGDVHDALVDDVRKRLAAMRAGGLARPAEAPRGRKPQGVEVEIVQKETRATAISFGFPVEVTRNHPDFAALSIARAWLGEHRSSMAHLYQRIREVRGMNYGDYAYLEAFPGGMYSFFPPTGVGRRAQLFEVWIRPVVPQNAHMALRIAVHELRQLVEKGMSKEDFEAVREYLSKNVFVLTATQSQQLGYALDSRFYGIDEYTAHMRAALAKLTLEDVNAAIRRHLDPKNLSVVMITKDAEGLKQRLVSDEFSPITYEAAKPAELLAEDKVIGALSLGIAADKVTITPAEEVFR